MQEHDYYATRWAAISFEPVDEEIDWDSDAEEYVSTEYQDDGSKFNNGCEVGYVSSFFFFPFKIQ